ncbi:MAG: hypothetical protein ACTS46_01135 [Candidatus Hodgkinia cicadicola]
MLGNMNNDLELRTFIFNVLGIYSGWLASLCKIWEVSCQLFVRLLGLLANNEDGPATKAEQPKPAEAVTEVNDSLVERTVHESQLPAVEQNVSAEATAEATAEAKVEASTEHVEVSKDVEATAETTKQASTEAKCASAVEADEGNKTNSNVDKPKLETTEPNLTSTPPVEETKPEVTSAPSVEETKPEVTETTSEPAEGRIETTSETTEESSKTTEGVPTSNVVEVVETTPSAEEEHVNSSPPSEGEPSEAKSLNEINEFNEGNELMSSAEADELLSSLGASDEEFINNRLKKPERTAECKRSSAVRDEELSEASEGKTKTQVQSNKTSRRKRVSSKRKPVSPQNC